MCFLPMSETIFNESVPISGFAGKAEGDEGRASCVMAAWDAGSGGTGYHTGRDGGGCGGTGHPKHPPSLVYLLSTHNKSSRMLCV